MIARDWQPGRVELSDGHLAYHRKPGGEQAVLLLHGLTDNGLCWRRAGDLLAEDFDVILLDARGHGHSSMPSTDTPDDPAGDIAEVVQCLGLEAPVVMGHSLGARAAAAFANAHPRIPQKVILEDPPFLSGTRSSPSSEQLKGFRKQILEFRDMSDEDIVEFGKRQHPSWREDEFPDWAAAKKQVHPDVMARYRFVPWTEIIRAIRAPTLLIYGDPTKDGIVNADIAAQASRLNPSIQSVSIAGAGHNVRRENFAEYMRRVREFLLPGAGRPG